jgi:hypothetical protein
MVRTGFTAQENAATANERDEVSATLIVEKNLCCAATNFEVREPERTTGKIFKLRKSKDSGAIIFLHCKAHVWRGDRLATRQNLLSAVTREKGLE